MGRFLFAAGCFLSLTETTMASGYTSFPRPPAYGVVEAITDKGLTLELIVNCGHGAQFMTYSPLERVYCAADLRCSHGFALAYERTCARD